MVRSRVWRKVHAMVVAMVTGEHFECAAVLNISNLKKKKKKRSPKYTRVSVSASLNPI